jgi:hypothetical protein
MGAGASISRQETPEEKAAREREEAATALLKLSGQQQQTGQQHGGKKRQATRNSPQKICKTQIEMGKKILRTKTRKDAMKLLKKVPHMKDGNSQKGINWWEYIQSVPEKDRAKIINNSAKPMMEACIQKYTRKNN